MSFEKAANPNKMASYLSAFNSANLGKVANTGTIQDTMTDVNQLLNNADAEDTKNEMYYKGLASEATIDHRAEMAGMEMDANRTNSWLSAGTSAAFGAMKGSDFSLFGGGPQIGTSMGKTRFSQPHASGIGREALGGYDL